MTRAVLALAWDVALRVCGIAAAILMVHSTITHDIGMATYYGVIVLLADKALEK